MDNNDCLHFHFFSFYRIDSALWEGVHLPGANDFFKRNLLNYFSVAKKHLFSYCRNGINIFILLEVRSFPSAHDSDAIKRVLYDIIKNSRSVEGATTFYLFLEEVVNVILLQATYREFFITFCYVYGYEAVAANTKRYSSKSVPLILMLCWQKCNFFCLVMCTLFSGRRHEFSFLKKKTCILMFRNIM
jgi:hypothetical protein